MKKLILYICLLISSYSYGQDWKDFSIDSTVTVKLPAEHDSADDPQGFHFTSANTQNGMVLVTTFRNEGKFKTAIKNEEELIKYYKDYQSGVVSTLNGEVLQEEISAIKAIKVYKFTLKVTNNGKSAIRNYVLFFLKNKTYSIQYMHLADDNASYDTEKRIFFSSINFPENPDINHQFTVSAMGTLTGGNTLKTIAPVLLLILVISTVILFAIRARKRRNEKNRLENFSG